MARLLFALASAVFSGLVLAQVDIPKLAEYQAFSYEDKDWGVAPESRPQGPPFGKPTPTSIPGARVIKTLELKALLESTKEVVVIDALGSSTRTTIPGAYWMPGAGARFGRAENFRFAAALEKITGGDKNRPIVFLCLSSECWESYNACLHALEAGYHQPFISSRPVLGHQIHDGLHRIITRNHLRQVVHGPHLRVIVNARNVLVGRDLVYRQRRSVAQKLPRRRQVLPERHLDLTPASLSRNPVKLRRGLDNPALAELRQFRRSFNRVLFKLCGDDDVRHCCLSHKSIFRCDPLRRGFEPRR